MVLVGDHEREFEVFRTAIVRIYHLKGTVVGTGFLVGKQSILTCAHVVTAALGVPQSTSEKPSDFIELDFPFVDPGRKKRARVTCWVPVASNSVGDDIAVLTAVDSFSDSVEPLKLIDSDNFLEHKVRLLGFPKEHIEGIWATGILQDRLANSWIQLDAISAQHRTIEKGFSGAPVWDSVLKGVIGIAVAAEKRRDNASVTSAFVLPTALLKRVWVELDVKEDTSLSKTSSNKKQEAREQNRVNVNRGMHNLPLRPPCDSPQVQFPHHRKVNLFVSECHGANNRLLGDYGELTASLEKKNWRKADLDTATILLQITKKSKAGWLSPKSIERFPCSDLQMLDELWRDASDSRFGFSAQLRLWLDADSKPRRFDPETFREFGECVGWRKDDEWLRSYDSFIFSSGAPEGHLPSLRFPRAEEGINWFNTWKSSFKGFLARSIECWLNS
ncbi:MAG: GUN4 domain-containing protein [Phormidesmis sp.]